MAVDFVAFQNLINAGLVAALCADGPEPWTWRPDSIQALEQQVFDIYHWTSCIAAHYGGQVNRHNPVNRLPDEILCMIFAEVVAPGDVEGRLLLCDVCCHWRDTVLNNKALWTTIRLDETDPETIGDVDLLSALRWRLERAEPAPLDLSLRFRGDIRGSRLEEPLREHMHHIRSLALVVREDLPVNEWRTAFTMPAPRLTALTFKTIYYTQARQAVFPPNLFSGEAPRLRDLFLEIVSLPPPTWSPLRSLEHFTYTGGRIDLVELARFVLACPCLHTLRFRAVVQFVVPNNVWQNSVPPPSAPTRLTSVVIWDSYDVGTQVDRFLIHARCQDPTHLFLSLKNPNQNLLWLSDAMHDAGMDELHLSDCDVTSHNDFGVTARARNSAGKTRSAYLDNIVLSSLSPTFSLLTRLTLPEAMWPESDFPNMPQLVTLSVLLEDPGKTAYIRNEVPIGIFFLPLKPDSAWNLPALRSLHLAYVGAEDDDSVEQLGPSKPLVVSALEIVTFLTWNLSTSHRIRLVLESLLLAESLESESMRQLRELVDELGLGSTYTPPAFVPVSFVWT